MAHALQIESAASPCSLPGLQYGNDGLTDAERAAHAARWRKGAGATPSRAEMNRLRALTARQAG